MKIVRETVNKKGKRVVTVELDTSEKLMTFNDDHFYRIGGQVDEVMAGYVITGAAHVVWCSIEQKWVE